MPDFLADARNNIKQVRRTADSMMRTVTVDRWTDADGQTWTESQRQPEADRFQISLSAGRYGQIADN